MLCNLIRSEAGSRNLYHGTYLVRKIYAGLLDLFVSRLDYNFLHIVKFLYFSSKRNHDFRCDLPIRMLLLYIDGCTNNGFRLHNGNFRIGYGKTQSSVSHHRVELVEGGNDVLNLLHALVLCLCKLLNLFFLLRYELMKRRIQETDGYGVPFQCLIKSFEVSLLIRKNLLQRFFSLFLRIGYNHLTESEDSLRIKEHVLCTAKSDTFGTELSCLLCIMRCIGIGTNSKLSVLVSPAHDPSELTGNGCIYCRNDALIDISGSSVDGNVVSLMEGLSAEGKLLVCLIHDNIAKTGYTAGSHTTCHYGSVRSHTATNGQDTLCTLHTRNIFRRSLKTYQNDLLSSFMPSYGIVCGEYHLTASSSR